MYCRKMSNTEIFNNFNKNNTRKEYRNRNDSHFMIKHFYSSV